LSQSPQTGQVYFNETCKSTEKIQGSVSIPSNGSSLFQFKSASIALEKPVESLNPLKRVKFISMKEQEFQDLIASYVSIPSNGSSLFQ